MAKITEVGAGILAWFDNLDPNIQTAIMAAAGLTVGLLALAAAASVLTAAAGALTVVLGILTSPITLVVVAIAALVAGLIIAYKECETFRKIVDGTIDSVTQVIQGFIDFSKKAWKDWGDVIMGAVNVVMGVIKTNVAIIQGIIQVVVDLLHGDWSQAWEDFKGAVDRRVGRHQPGDRRLCRRDDRHAQEAGRVPAVHSEEDRRPRQEDPRRDHRRRCRFGR